MSQRRHQLKPKQTQEQELFRPNEVSKMASSRSGEQVAVDLSQAPHVFSPMCNSGLQEQVAAEATGDYVALKPKPNLAPAKGTKKNTGNDRRSREVSSDFFTDPIHKMLRDRRFPFKLTVSCLMLLFYILLVTLYQTPEFFESEQQRKAVLHHFLGDDYLGKDKGDVVLRPTIYLHSLEDVRKGIQDFVTVYYALSNTSLGELQYYYYANAEKEDGASLLRRVAYDASPQHLRNLHAKLRETMDESIRENYELNLTWVEPVSMNVEAYLYSPQEHRGPTPQRSFSFLLTETDPLGPFSNEDDSVAQLKNDGGSKAQSMRHAGVHGEKGMDPLASGVDNYVDAVCAPRYDEIAGQYYNPCRRSRGDKGTPFVFPLFDNVRKICLRASVRHLADAAVDRHDAASGFSALVYLWTVKKTFWFHPGGLVEVTFDTSVTTRHIQPRVHPRFFLLFVLLLLALYDMMLRFRALRRIKASRCSTTTTRTTGGLSFFMRDRWQICASGRKRVELGATPHAACVSPGDEPVSPVSSSDMSTNSKTVFRTSPDFCRRLLHCNSGNDAKRAERRDGGSPMPETTYNDFYDVCRQQLQESKGMGWQCMAFVSDVITLSYILMSSLRLSSFSLSGHYDDLECMLCGLSGLLLSVNLLSYLRYFPQIFFTLRATQNVIPKLFLFVLSISPVFVGFASFFWIVFGPHSNGLFSNLNFSFVVLYFVMYGDAILPTIKSAEGSAFFVVKILANAMTMIFILLFMMTMLNLAMSITQYEWVRLRRGFGACFSAGNMLFTVRTRDQVREEALEAVIVNLELLLQLSHEEQLNAEAPVEVEAGAREGLATVTCAEDHTENN